MYALPHVLLECQSEYAQYGKMYASFSADIHTSSEEEYSNRA